MIAAVPRMDKRPVAAALIEAADAEADEITGMIADSEVIAVVATSRAQLPKDNRYSGGVTH